RLTSFGSTPPAAPPGWSSRKIERQSAKRIGEFAAPRGSDPGRTCRVGEQCRLERNYRPRPQIDDIVHLAQGHRTASALAVAVDDKQRSMRGIALAEHIAQPRRIAHRTQGLVADDDPEIGQ